MRDNRTGVFGLILGGVVAIAAVLFVLSGGSKQTVESDRDLPPVAAAHGD